MKARNLGLVFVLTAGSLLTAAEVAPGASLWDVRAALGTPRGELKAGDRHVLYYERGTVELQNGVLVRSGLRSPEEQAALAAREQRTREERQASRAALVAEGTALRDRKMGDAAFLAAPVAYQVSFWEDFAQRYPEVSCAEPMMLARLRLREQLDEKQRQYDEELDRRAEREERYAERRTIYPLYTTSYNYRWHRHHDQPFDLGSISYTFFDKPLPAYSTPSGNPAGSLSGPVVSRLTGNPAQPARNDRDRFHGDDDREDRHSGRSSGRDFGSGGGRWRGRM
jgi:hypothetical protein